MLGGMWARQSKIDAKPVRAACVWVNVDDMQPRHAALLQENSSMRTGFAISVSVAALLLGSLAAGDAAAQTGGPEPAPNVTQPQPKMPGRAPVPRQLTPPAAEDERESADQPPFQGCPDSNRRLELIV